MPTYTPSIFFFPTGVVSVVSTDKTPYNVVVESTGSTIYKVTEMYINSNSISQILQPYRFNKKNANGTIDSFVDIPIIDPYQFQTCITRNLSKDNVILDGKTAFDFPILANEILFLVLTTNEDSVASLLPPTNFFNNDFFNDYKEEI